MTNVRFLYILLAALSILSSGCDKQVSDYVTGVKRNLPSDSNAGEGEPLRFKITPGKLDSTLIGGGRIKGTITPTDKLLTVGPDMSMSITINRAKKDLQ